MSFDCWTPIVYFQFLFLGEIKIISFPKKTSRTILEVQEIKYEKKANVNIFYFRSSQVCIHVQNGPTMNIKKKEDAACVSV